MRHRKDEPMLPGIKEWLEEMQVAEMSQKEIDEANSVLDSLEVASIPEIKDMETQEKTDEPEMYQPDIFLLEKELKEEEERVSAEIRRAKQERYERIWREREYRLSAGSTHDFKFKIVKNWTYKGEADERLADVFSRYFKSPRQDVSSYDFFLKFFQNYTTSVVRWNRMPTEIHLRDVWMETPFSLKNMPYDSKGYANLAMKIFPLIIKAEKSYLASYIRFVEQTYSKAGMSESSITALQKSSYNELLAKEKQERAEYDKEAENLDTEYGYNSQATVNILNRCEKEIKKYEDMRKVMRGMLSARDISRRADLTESEYKEYQKARKRKSFVNPLDKDGNIIEPEITADNYKGTNK